MILYFACLLVMTMLGSIASLFLKKASAENGIFEMIKNKNLYVGAGLYLVSAVMNIWVLRYLDYSIVLPLTSLTYVWTLILSYMILREKITARKIIGVILILIGAILVSV